jgi:hypothetical protein
MIGGVGYFHGKTVIKGDDGTHSQVPKLLIYIPESLPRACGRESHF